MNRPLVRRRGVALGLAACLAGLAAAPAAAQRALAKFARSSLAIRAGGKLHRFTVEVARTPREHAQGLMFRRRMAADAGMLFVYDPPRPVSMWMRNTHIPLDMIFIAPSGRISQIVERTVPLSTENIPSRGTVRAVLELNAGTAARLGIRPGQVVATPALGS
ncbi:MAG: DUF192 domain-containing protein [Defluviicoccus sp.]|nr:DUF192 domain-containing protein [Defluviicoccus sp.]MDE0386885.1 DUF192 domain-containing protein [Defluviicoccus sp.]